MGAAGGGSVRVTRVGRVLELRLERAEARNAFDRAMFDQLAMAVRSVGEEASALLIAAEGPAFSAGWDRGELSSGDEAAYAETSAAYRRMMAALEECDVPVVAAVDGPAVGIGFTILGHCDLVVIGRRARFSAPFVSLGLVPEAGSTALLPPRLGPHLTAELMYTARWLEAEEAIAAGLGVAATHPRSADETALALAERIASHPREALTRTKQLLRRGRTLDAPAARAAESLAFRALRARG